MNGAGQRPWVFLWENLGPTHDDRLQAVVRAEPERRIVAIQYARESHTYAWRGVDPACYDRRTLFATGRPTGLGLAIRLLRACLREGRAEFFLCHYQEWPVLLAACVLRLLGRRAFCMVDSKFDDRERHLAREMVKSAFLAPYCGALTASNRSRDYLRFLGVPATKIALGYDSLSIDRIVALAGAPPAPAGVGFADRDLVVVARHVAKKNITTAIDAYALWLERAGHPRDLHLVGSGPLETELRAQVARLRLNDRVHFHGFVQAEEVAKILARGLCLLLPSIEEQFGLVVIEAQAMGLPVLAGANAGACDVLIDTGLNGFVLDPRKPESWAAAMALLSEDKDHWRRMAVATLERRDRGDCRHFVDGVRFLVAAKGGLIP